MWCKNSRVNQSNMSRYRELRLWDHFLCWSWKYELKMSQNISWLPSITQPSSSLVFQSRPGTMLVGQPKRVLVRWWQIEGSIGYVLLICKTDHGLYMSLHQYLPKKDGILWVSSPCVDCWCFRLSSNSINLDVRELIPSPNILCLDPPTMSLALHQGWTPLHSSAAKAQLPTLQMLLALKADPEELQILQLLIWFGILREID